MSSDCCPGASPLLPGRIISCLPSLVLLPMNLRKLIYAGFKTLARGEIARLEQSSRQPRQAQLARLADILSRARSTAFGRDHGLSSARSYEDFRSAVPVSDYDRHRPYIDRIVQGEKGVLTSDDPFMLATTSGTTGAQKFIPVTPSYIREFRRASTASCYHLFSLFPGLADGCTLSVFSPAEEGRTAGGLPYGAISGGLYLREPAAMKRFISPIPYEVYRVRDYEARYYAILRAALALPISSVYTLNPSTIAILARRLRHYGAQLARDVYDGQLRPPAALHGEAVEALRPFLRPDPERGRHLERLAAADRCLPVEVWPDLEVVCCWTRAAAAFYLADFPEYFGSIPVCDITYGASEGRGSVFLGPDRQMLALRSHFFEFIPEDEIDSASPTVLLADELESGRQYFILFTTSSGIYRYHINDVVKVVGFHNQCPLIEFQYKGGNVFSFTGEKITELQVTRAMSSALAELDLKVRFFTLVPEFHPQPHYRLWFEPVPGASAAGEHLACEFDRQLACANSEYRTKRQSLRLDAVRAEELVVGAYEAYRQEMVSSGVPDSQIKVSHLNPKDETRAYFGRRLAQPCPGI